MHLPVQWPRFPGYEIVEVSLFEDVRVETWALGNKGAEGRRPGPGGFQ